ARRRAAAPLVAEQDLLAVVAEGGRVPERHVRIGDEVDTLRMRGVADVEQQAEARARAAGEADFRIHRDVVALVRPGRRPLVAAAAPAASRTGRTGRTRSRAGRTCRAGR